jgi:hypothetical protein
MVAKIKSGKSLTGALNYNENKVKVGKAVLIATNGYVRDPDKLTFYDKLFRLTDLVQRNIRTKTNTVHISLNFHISEKIGQEKLIDISVEYMKQIGFGNQPYLVYEHSDAGHPHVHIVTTNIRPDGKRISLHYIGEKFSEPAREAIEIQFGLVKAVDHRMKEVQDTQTALSPVAYGKSDTKRAITNIVNNVTRSYKFTSLPELNAVLNQYNITADRGSKGSVMFNNSGLNYWITDDKGKKVGVPIKASSIYQKPTLKLLEGRFKLNEVLRKPFKNSIIKKLDRLIRDANSLDGFKAKLSDENITLIVRQNEDGRIYGLSYVDHQAKVVFNGSDLGKAYSAASIVASLRQTSSLDLRADMGNPTRSLKAPLNRFDNGGRYLETTILSDLLAPAESNSFQGDFGPKRKRKKRKRLNL